MSAFLLFAVFPVSSLPAVSLSRVLPARLPSLPLVRPLSSGVRSQARCNVQRPDPVGLTYYHAGKLST
jgi:hypothetical protein